MTDSVTVQIKGLKELAEALIQMPQKLAGKALGSSVKAGADLIRDRVRAAAPVDTEAVRKSIMSYRRRGSTPKAICYEVGVTMKKRYPRKGKGNLPAYWWIFTEFGTTKLPAGKWFRNTWSAYSGQALAMIKMMLQKAVVIAAAQVPKYRG